MGNKRYVLLAGGVGAAKFIEGLANVVSQESLTIIVNTGDDIDLFGLKICPDLDIITYTLADVVDNEKGWGFREESFNCLEILKKYYDFGWFNAGDKDIATHIYRTDLHNKGFNKYQIAQKIADKLGVKAHIIPMCNESFETYIEISSGKIHFEEYFIKERCEPEVLSVYFKGSEKAKANEIIFECISNADKIIICPSNPIVSIGTILSVPGIKEALVSEKHKVVAISPIINGAPVKGPADKLMKAFGLEVSCLGVAKFYKEFVDHIVIDNIDCSYLKEIKKLGIQAHCYDTIMKNQEKKEALAQFVVELAI
ncbi:MAG: 2-phospho-L-lactate transferase [Promethearchaeota archaeon]